jgi:hypothetical protein
MLADDSDRRILLAAGVGSGVGMSGIAGLAIGSITTVSGLAVASLLAAPLIPVGGYIGIVIWRRRLRQSFPGMPIDEYLDAHEVVRKDYQQRLHDIREMKLPRQKEQELMLDAYYESSERLKRMLIKTTVQGDTQQTARVGNVNGHRDMQRSDRLRRAIKLEDTPLQ